MDTRPVGAHGTSRSFIAASAVLTLLMAVAATSAAAASPTVCRVQNTDTGQTFAALQEAVDAAASGDRITVEGTCHGVTVIGRDLVISGLASEASGRPILDGDGLGSVVTVVSAVVSIEDLTIEDGAVEGRRNGEGLRNRLGTVTLRDVTVRGDHPMTRSGHRGVGIFNQGTLTLAGASRIEDHAGSGVWVRGGVLTMNGTSAISGNGGRGIDMDGGTLTMNGRSAIRDGGSSGVSAWGGTIVMNDRSSIRGHRRGGGVRLHDHAVLTMNDSSTIKGNRALMEGGGVAMEEGTALTMNDASRITANAADVGTSSHDYYGGGIHSYRGDLVGVICAPKTNANVTGNTPDDCYVE